MANGSSPDDALAVSMPAALAEIPVLAERIEAFCDSHDIGPGVAHAINLSLDELLTNIVSYGFDDPAGHTIDVRLEKAADAVTVVLSDDARPFDPFSAPDPDTDAALEDRPIGGLGVFLVRELMDGVEYRRVDGRNVVTLNKRIGTETDATE